MISKIFKTKWQGEGVGASVMRSIGTSTLPDLDPFLLLDLFKVRLPAGFPDHPHRGFEAVTYMISGTMLHEDFKGNKGTIGPGAIQWMTAGRGIVHAEMPGSADEDSIGLQLWINLPHDKKMMAPRYQDIGPKQLPFFEDDKKKVIVIAGEYHDVKSKLSPESVAHYYDVHLQGGSSFEHVIPDGWNALVYPYTDLPFSVQDTPVPAHSACVLIGEGKMFKVHNSSPDQVNKFIVIYGKPLNELVAIHGTMVMNTDAEIKQAFEDYQEGKNGFEGADKWTSKLRDLSNL